MIIIKSRVSPNQSTESTTTESHYFSASLKQWEQAMPSRWSPPVDIFEQEDQFVIRMEVAGMIENDFNIILEKDLLSIRGIRHDPQPKRAFHQMEIHYGEFHTEIGFSAQILYDEVSAVYKNGFLIIEMPKAKPRQINIHTS